jgi:hypothetical protein
MADDAASSSADREARRARNEVVIRKLNEKLEEEHLRVRPSVPQFVCECFDASCAITVSLTIAEYETVRAEPTHFFVAPAQSHVSADIEHVVRSEPSHWVVAKIGAAAEISRSEQSARRI